MSGARSRSISMNTSAFTRKHCEKTDGMFHLREPAKDCGFLDGARCTVTPRVPSNAAVGRSGRRT